MSLEKLINSLKWADKEILTWYSRKAEKWESKNRSINSLACPIGILAIPPYALGVENISPIVTRSLYFTVYLFDWTWNLGWLFGAYRSEPKITDAVIAEDPRLWLRKQANRIVRFPTIGAGFFFLAKSGYDIIDFISNGAPESLNQFTTDLNAGVGLTGFASSMYLKGRDPKLLDKEPLLKRAYNWIQERIGYTPQPAPIPVRD